MPLLTTQSARGYGFGSLQTPVSTNSYESIQTVTVPSGGSGNISLNSIPQTYKHLQLRMIYRTTVSTPDDNVVGTFSGDTNNNYVTHYISNNGSTLASAIVAAGIGVIFLGRQSGATSPASLFGSGVVDIIDYSATNKSKTIKSVSGWNTTSASQYWYWSGAWMNTTAVTSISITGPFAEFSSFALYGIKG